MEYLPIIAICVSIIGLLYQQFGVLENIKERLSALETKMDLFWKAIEGNVAHMLKTFPTNINKDILLDEFSKGELTLEEAQKLRTILMGEMEISDKSAIGNKLAYVLVIGRLEQVIHDLRNNHKKTIWQRFLSF